MIPRKLAGGRSPTLARKTRRRQRRRRMGMAAGVVACALTGLLSGCQATPRSAASAPLPKMNRVQSNRVEKEAEHGPRIAPPAQGLANFQQIALPLNVPTDHAWEIVDEDAFPSVTRAVWNANGLRVGVLDRSRIRRFIEALPPADGVRRSQLLASAHPTPILRTPWLRGEATIDLTIPPMAPHEIHVTGGRLQLLARLTRGAGGDMVFDLLPHHYVPKLTLKPRGPLQKELDGRIFKQLTLRTHLDAGKMLVVGLYRPWPKTTPRTPSMPTLPRDHSRQPDSDHQTPSDQPTDAPSAGGRGRTGQSSTQGPRPRPAPGTRAASSKQASHPRSQQDGPTRRQRPHALSLPSLPVNDQAKRSERQKSQQSQGAKSPTGSQGFQGSQDSERSEGSRKLKKLTPEDVLGPRSPQDDLAKPPPLSNDLGRALFALLRKGHPTQRILLISIEPLGNASPKGGKGSRDQGTKGPRDQGIKGSRDQGVRSEK